MNKALDLETRKKIYHLIAKNPGLNLSKIAEMLQMNVPLVDYHTRYLKDDGLINIEIPDLPTKGLNRFGEIWASLKNEYITNEVYEESRNEFSKDPDLSISIFTAS